MYRSAAVAALSKLSRSRCGVFRGCDAVDLGVQRNQLTALCEAGVLSRVLPDVYRLAAVGASDEQRLRAALLWGGEHAAADGRSAGWWYGIEGIRAVRPEIVVAAATNRRAREVRVRRVDELGPLMIRNHRGLRVSGVEATIVQLGHLLDDEGLEIACEHARRKQLTSMAALNAYLDRYARPGLRGVRPLRALLGELDPKHPSRSTLEVKARRLLVAHGLNDFVREHPLEGPRGTYHFDFAFLPHRTILETNGKRFHDDPVDYEYDNEKWSVPALHGFKLVLATWHKVTRRPDALVAELLTAFSA